MRKSTTSILETALSLVRKLGFESVSISQLAKEVGMSKSGLFAHFNSKEKMHLMILDHAAQSFYSEFVSPALKVQRGIPRLRAIIKTSAVWYGSESDGGCPFVTAAVEYDSRPGTVKDRVQLHLGNFIKIFKRAIGICIEEKHIKADTNIDQLAFEIYSATIGSMVYKKTLAERNTRNFFDQSIENILSNYLLPKGKTKE